MKAFDIFPYYVNFQWFTSSALQTIGAAAGLATDIGDSVIYPEHLFVSIFKNDKEIALGIQEIYEFKIDKLCEAIKQTPEFAPSNYRKHILYEVVHTQLSFRTRHILRQAFKKAKKLKHSKISANHIVLAILEERHGRLAALIRELEIDCRLCCEFIENSFHLKSCK